MSSQLVFSWILGGIFITLGVWVVNNLEFGIGVSEMAYAIAMVVAAIFILIGGLLWINVSVAVKHKF